MKKILLTSLLALGSGLAAQIGGSKTIGTDYPTLSAAFADLNTNGVASGGLTINIPAGYTETSPAGGYLLGSTVLNASLSSTSQLIIQKSGDGSNPTFTGNTGTSTTVDAIFKFSGVDYVTLDGIDLKENTANTTALTLNERGFAFYNLTSTDGCNNNTIKNSTVTFLKTVNNTAVGIMFVHTNTAGVTTNPTSTDGTHSNNKIYGNTIVKSIGHAINFTGYAAPSPYTLYDQGNDVGGSSSASGNTLTDIGGVAGGAYVTTNYGFYNMYQNNENISNNTINFAPDGMGTIGIQVFGTNSTFTTNNNIINATGQTNSSTGTQHVGIYANSTGLNLTANNNLVNVLATTYNSRSPIYGIWSANSGGNFSANGNTITANGNDMAYGIYSNASGTTVNIINNTIRNITSSGSSATTSGIYLNSTGITTNISGNKISNIFNNGNLGLAYGLYVGGSVASTTNIFNNLIGDIKLPLGTTGSNLSGIHLVATATGTNTSKINVYYNTINLDATSTGANFNSNGIYHAQNSTSTRGTLDLRNNLIINTSTPTGTGTAAAFRRSNATDLNNYATSSDNNDFVVGPAGFVYFDGTTKYNLADFKSLVSTRESNSLSVTPQFLSSVGTETDFLKLNGYASANAQLDNKGANIADYTTDFAGVTRNSATPDIGAYEFTYSTPTVAPNCTTVTAPTNASTGITPNPVTISWTKTENASGYKLFLGTTSEGAEIVNGTIVTGLSYTSNLEKNKTHFVKVVPTNDMGDASGCSEISFSTGNNIYCTPTFPTVEPITNVTFAGINNSSSAIVNGTSGYQDFTNIIGEVTAGNTSAMTVAGNTNGNLSSYYIVFIDWNQNGILNDAGEAYFRDGSMVLVNSNGTDGQTVSGSISVPENAKSGLTRMRVKKELAFSAPSTTSNFNNPCDRAQINGQAEDYTLNVLPKETLAVDGVNQTKIMVYPNPFTDMLNISDIKGIKSISIADMTGRQVKKLTPSSTIDLRNFNIGTYIVNIQMMDGNMKSFKVIKK